MDSPKALSLVHGSLGARYCWFRLKTGQANFREQVMISSWAFVLGPYNSPPPPTIPFSDRRDGIVVTLTARGELCLKLLLLDTKR